MRLIAKWHIWLGWLAGVPLLMWTITGLAMVAKPIEEVRGEHLRIEQPDLPLPLPPGQGAAIRLPAIATGKPIKSLATEIAGRAFVTTVTYLDGDVARFTADGSPIAPLSDDDARALVADQIVGGENVAGTALFEADDVPIDFRRSMPVWQVRLADRTHVYVGRDTGQIEAVRTRWWRIFDTMWGLHIMDLESREDTSHPVLIGFTALAVITVLIGLILLFRRRKARLSIPNGGRAID